MFIEGKAISNRVEGIIHEDTQIQENSLHLTISKIRELKQRGSLDFGGSEREIGEASKITPTKKSEEDKYGWWKLNEGGYLIEFNEKIRLEEDDLGLIEPLSFVEKNGTTHRVKLFSGKLKTASLLLVGNNGIDIKENARISKLRIWR